MFDALPDRSTFDSLMLMISAKPRGNAAGEIVKSLLCPNLLEPEHLDFFVQTKLELLSICFALQKYKIQHGAFPEVLEKLVPHSLAELPVDRLTGEFFCTFPPRWLK